MLSCRVTLCCAAPMENRARATRRQATAPVYFSVLFLLVSAAPLWAQGKKTQSFVLNPAKPYAYIVFDHAGKRPPLGPGESKYGYWLRLVNNSRLPIEVTVFATNYPKPGAGDVLFDEVVPIPRGLISGFRLPPPPIKPRTGCPIPNAKPPEGYDAETASLMDIEPGKSLLFSIPSNQLSPDWYIQVKFNLVVSPDSTVVQPDSHVYFDWWRLPKAVRRLCK